MEHILPRTKPQASEGKRLFYSVAGGLLLTMGIKRHTKLGGLLSLLGADLISRGITGLHLHEALGIFDRADRTDGSRIPHQKGVKVDTSVMVNASPEKAYTYFRNLENLPCFMRHVKSVEPLGNNLSHWVVAGPAGTEVEWDAEIINDIPNRLIAWRSVDNPDVDTAGSIHFDPIAEDGSSRIRVSMQYLPPAGALGVVVAKFFGEEPEQQLEDDLSRLKLVLENAENPTSEPTQEMSPDQSRSAAAGSL